MTAAAHRALRAAIQTGDFAPVYYLHGDDDFQKDGMLRQLVGAAVDPATRDFNLETRRGADLDAETLDVLLNTLPMMAERRVAVIRDVGSMKKDARQALERYLARPVQDTVLVLVAPAGAKADEVLERAGTTLWFDPLSGDRVPKWIAHHASTVLDVGVTPEAAALLQSAVGNELGQLACELEKLASYTSGRDIDEAAVAAVVGVRREGTLGALLDHVAARDVRGALALVPEILSHPKTTGVQIVMALSTQVLALAWGLARRERGASVGSLRSEYFDFLKQTSPYPGRPWGEAVKTWTGALAHWTRDELDAALETLLLTDIALKESRVSSEEQVLSSAILAMCATGRREPAVGAA